MWQRSQKFPTKFDCICDINSKRKVIVQRDAQNKSNKDQNKFYQYLNITVTSMVS